MDIRDKLKELGLSQRELSRRCNVCENTMSSWMDKPPRVLVLYLDLLLDIRRLVA